MEGADLDADPRRLRGSTRRPLTSPAASPVPDDLDALATIGADAAILGMALLLRARSIPNGSRRSTHRERDRARDPRDLVRVELERGTGRATVDTGRAFLDHMLVTLARYSGLDSRRDRTRRSQAPPDRGRRDRGRRAPAGADATEPIARYGRSVRGADGRRAGRGRGSTSAGVRYYQGPLPSSLYDHWMRSFSDHARLTLHLRVLRGRDRHHVVEAAFKALGLALRDALAARRRGVQHQGPGRDWSGDEGAVLTRRVIACLDVHDGRVVKGVQLRRAARRRRSGRSARARTSAEGADEIVFLDISATRRGRAATLLEIARRARRTAVRAAHDRRRHPLRRRRWPGSCARAPTR